MHTEVTKQTSTQSQILQTAKQVISTEQQAISRLLDTVNNDFVKACELLIHCHGRIVVSGIGKSGHIAHKIAASFASLGSPAFFLHAAEALHGDIGMLTHGDILIVLSYSGSSNEILSLIPSIKHLNIPVIAITGNPESPLAIAANIHLPVYIDQEACYLNLAPTASTTAMLALGDALVVSVTKTKQFTEEDFARSHPGGNLGRRLLLCVQDIMVKQTNLAFVPSGSKLSDALIVMSSKGMGMIAITDTSQNILGIFTDGDLRRLFETDNCLSAQSFSEITIDSIMNKNFKSIPQHTLAATAWQFMCSWKINGLLVTESDHTSKLLGMINIHTLIAAKII